MNNTERKKVLLGMSGGVDSSTAAVLLQEQGYDVIGVTMQLWQDNDFKTSNSYETDPVTEAKKICDKLNIPHYTLDLSNEFKQYVVNDFINNYKHCKTPNPCIQCNKHLKFGLMFDFAHKLGAEYVATGHYANTYYSEKFQRYVIKKSISEKKDQSYVLYVIDKEKIPFILFPLGNFKSKDDIRAIAESYGLITAQKPDSQEICFIPNNNSKGFLDKYIPPHSGNIVNSDGKILGKHNGITHYTIGQRKGLGVSNPTPIFVTALNEKTNTVTVGSNNDLFSAKLTAENINWQAIDNLKQPMRVFAKIRYAAKEMPATISPISNDSSRISILFDEPQRAATPGQSVVFYDDDCIIGGGIIV